MQIESTIYKIKIGAGLKLSARVILNYMCLRLYLTCRGQGRSSSHGTVCTTVLL